MVIATGRMAEEMRCLPDDAMSFMQFINEVTFRAARIRSGWLTTECLVPVGEIFSRTVGSGGPISSAPSKRNIQ
jgi:hypothetical protein